MDALLTSLEEFNTRLVTHINRDDMDMASKKALIRTELVSACENGLLWDGDSIAYRHLVIEFSIWYIFKMLETEDYLSEMSLSMEMEYQHIANVQNIVCMSFEQVMGELHQLRTYDQFSAERLITSLGEHILASFDFLCKKNSIENYSYTLSLRDFMKMALVLAKEYVNDALIDEVPFSSDNLEFTDSFALRCFKDGIRGGYFDDRSSNIQQTVKAYKDDDIVGLDGDVIKITEQLRGNASNLHIIPIVGMGGIGKTTLARSVYEDPQIKLHFHVRAWTTISQNFDERYVLLNILQLISPLPQDLYNKGKEQLAECLYRGLKGRRYFIVLDDIWSKEAWAQIKLCFPDDENGSRIVMTTRISEVASYVSLESSSHFMNFLGLEDSWELLRKQVFGEEACPPQLVNIGRQIAMKCQGLPIAIKVLAGHLSNIRKKQEYWEDVANRVDFSTKVSQVESPLDILSTSYNSLSKQLKACFLTMATFPKNFDIPVKKLVKYWTALGFLHFEMSSTVEYNALEELGMKCLDDLISRNLIMVKKRKFDGKAKLCGTHDLLWDLSLREAQNEGHSIFGGICWNNFYFYPDQISYVMGVCSTLRYIYHSFQSDCPISGSSEFKPLKVLDIVNQHFDYFPQEIMELVNLRYLELDARGNIPESVSKLCSLETFINNHEQTTQILPSGIWSLAHLRHLRVGIFSFKVNELSNGDIDGSRGLSLCNLQTLTSLCIGNCTKEVLLKMPNLKKLGIQEPEEEYIEDELIFSCLGKLSLLNQLETLTLHFNLAIEKPRKIPLWDNFIRNIKNLTLVGGHHSWSQINALAMAPYLEVLKLKVDACDGSEWEMGDTVFLRLRCLVLQGLSELIVWHANPDNLPSLSCLIISVCVNLISFPLGISEIPDLQLIDVDYCTTPVFEGARHVQREQFNLGNEKLIVRLGHVMPQVRTA